MIGIIIFIGPKVFPTFSKEHSARQVAISKKRNQLFKLQRILLISWKTNLNIIQIQQLNKWNLLYQLKTKQTIVYLLSTMWILMRIYLCVK